MGRMGTLGANINKIGYEISKFRGKMFAFVQLGTMMLVAASAS